MSKPLGQKGSSEANRWAQERQEKINRAKIMKEERKLGSLERNIDREIGYPPQEQEPIQQQQKRFQQQRPPSQEDLSQAKNSLRLLKSKRPSYKQEEMQDDYDYNDDRAYDASKYLPPKTNSQALGNASNSRANAAGNQNYRKVFNPNMEEEQIDKKTSAIQSDLRQLNKNLSQKEKNLAGKVEVGTKPPLYSKSEFEMPPSTKRSRLPALAEENRTSNNKSRERSPNVTPTGRRISNGAIKIENNKPSSTGVYKKPILNEEETYVPSSTTKRQTPGGKPPMGGAAGGSIGGNSNSVSYGAKGSVGKSKMTSNSVEYDDDYGNSFDDRPVGGAAKGNTGLQKKSSGTAVNNQMSGIRRDSPKNKMHTEQYDHGMYGAESYEEEPYDSKRLVSKRAGPVKSSKPATNSSISSKNSASTASHSNNSVGNQHLSPNFKKPVGYHNPEDERPIAKGGNLEIEEYDESEFQECGGCGRKFNPASFPKHVKVCKKVFQSKRKAFDSASQREVIDENEAAIPKYIPPPKKSSKQQPPSKPTAKPGMDSRPIQGKADKQKWKKQSEAFRAIIKQAKGVKVSASEQRAMDQAIRDEQNLLTMCDYCGRRFNEKAAERHIPFCASKVKNIQIKQTSKKMPGPSYKKY